MSAPGYGPPQASRNPFGNPQQAVPHLYAQPRRDYDADSEIGDGYDSVNASSTRLAGSQNNPYEKHGG
jgi:hypothetical protein